MNSRQKKARHKRRMWAAEKLWKPRESSSLETEVNKGFLSRLKLFSKKITPAIILAGYMGLATMQEPVYAEPYQPDYAAEAYDSADQQKKKTALEKIASTVGKITRGAVDSFKEVYKGKNDEHQEKNSGKQDRVINVQEQYDQEQAPSRVVEPRQLTSEEVFFAEAIRVYRPRDKELGISPEEVELNNNAVYSVKVELEEIQGVPEVISAHYVAAEHKVIRAISVQKRLQPIAESEKILYPELEETKDLFEAYLELYREASEDLEKVRKTIDTLPKTRGLDEKVDAMNMKLNMLNRSFNQEIEYNHVIVKTANMLYKETWDESFKGVMSQYSHETLRIIDEKEQRLHPKKGSPEEKYIEDQRGLCMLSLMQIGEKIDHLKKVYGKDLMERVKRSYKAAPRKY